jgi:Xaa-Pro aminopeptidase
MSDEDAGLMVLSPGSNLRYMTGINIDPSDREFLLLIPSLGDPNLIVPEIESEKVEHVNFDVRFYGDDEEFGNVLGSVLSEIGVPDGRILLDNRMWVEVSQEVRDKISGKDYGLASEVLKDVRMVKGEDEINNIKKASKIVDKVVEDIRELDPVGKTEEELADFIENKMSEYGGEGTSFDTTVAAGENAGNAHHVTSDREIQAGEMVIMDFGCWVNGYASDQTRTMVFGDQHPTREAHEVHDIVRTAQQKAVEAVKPGIKASHVDRIARDIIEEAGYGDKFNHRTGHGVGLDIHEKPDINQGEDTMLKPGMVFSVEPGIYIGGKFGVRIEDLVLVTEDGCERLNKTPRGFN